MKYTANTWEFRNGVQINEVHICGDTAFEVMVNGAFVTAAFPDTPQEFDAMRDALDWAAEGGYSVGRLIEKALRMEE